MSLTLTTIDLPTFFHLHIKRARHLIKNTLGQANGELWVEVESFQYIDRFRVFGHFIVDQLVNARSPCGRVYH